MNGNRRSFRYCDNCGKKLIERLPNGIWVFCFGKKRNDRYIPVELLIHGSLKIKCLAKDCQSWNIFNYFPNVFSMGQSEAGAGQGQSAEAHNKPALSSREDAQTSCSLEEGGEN